MLLFALNPPTKETKMSRRVSLSKKSSRGRPLVRGGFSILKPKVRGRPRTATSSPYLARFVPGRKASPLVKYNLIRGDWARPVKLKGRKKPIVALNPFGIRRGVGDVWGPIRDQGVAGVAALAVGGGAGFMLPGVVNGLVNRFAPAAVSTGIVGTAVKVIASLAAASAVYRFAPAGVAKKAGAAVAVGTMGSVILELAKMVPVLRTVVSGVPSLAGYRRGMRGMGDMVSVPQMVQAEAIYRPMGDYMQLSGPVPQSLFAGGLNDFVEFKNQTDGKVAEAFSMVPTSPLAVAPEQF